MVQSDASEKIRRMFYAIGFAMTQWQNVEMALTQLFTLLVKGHGGVASAVFNAVPSLPTRLAMVKEAASVRLADDLAKECIKLCERLEKKSRKRNEIAHFTLYQHGFVIGPGEEVDLERYKDIDWYLAPTAFDGARHWRYKGTVPELKANDLMNRAQAFIILSNEIWEFSERVGGALATPPTP